MKKIKKMWDIDTRSILGDKITDDERSFFNENYERMRSQMEDNWTHWQFKSGYI